jgi:flagellar biosynthesis protein FlhF
MRLRRFLAPDTATALRRVKDALGPDAVILHTRSAPEGGVEITAAVDVDHVTDAIAAAAPPDVGAMTRELAELAARVRRLDRAVRPVDPEIAALGAEARALAERLALRGLATDLAARIAARFEAARGGGAAAGAALESSLASQLVRATPRESRVTAFIGPTGAGKTTTIAKLAARHVRGGRTSVGLVMADDARVGAREQLAAYSRLLGVPMETATNGTELRAALAAFADRDRVYIDTAGLGGAAADPGALQRLLAGAAEPVARAAVVSAGGSETALRAAWAQLGPLAPESCIVTKVDEGAGLAAACTWLHGTGLPLAWLGTGQRVPDDLAPPSGSALVRWVVAA